MEWILLMIEIGVRSVVVAIVTPFLVVLRILLIISSIFLLAMRIRLGAGV
jgi:hypothetical protein